MIQSIIKSAGAFSSAFRCTTAIHVDIMCTSVYHKQLHMINPLRACSATITIVVSVCLSVTTKYAKPFVYNMKTRCQRNVIILT